MDFRRRANRIPNYDYSTNGTYFVTICVEDRKPLMGMVVDTDIESGHLWN